MTNISIVDPNFSKAWAEVHKAGCSHLGKRKPVHYTLEEIGSRVEAAEEIASDFIDEGSMTVEDALHAIHFAPCLKELK